MVAGICKGFNLTFDYVLYDMSYANAILYSSVLPSFDSEKEKPKYEKSKDANDPNNFKNIGTNKVITKRNVRRTGI